MQRILIVFNPRSSRHADVEKEVLAPTKNLRGYIVGKYIVEDTNVDQNAAKFARLIKDGDLVISAGGDATAIIASNGVILFSPAYSNIFFIVDSPMPLLGTLMSLIKLTSSLGLFISLK